MSKSKNITNFDNEDKEREFWAKEDSTKYINWQKSKPIYFSKLKPSTKTISLRLPEYLLDELRMIANKRDIPYQSLIKIYLRERIDKELGKIT